MDDTGTIEDHGQELPGGSVGPGAGPGLTLSIEIIEQVSADAGATWTQIRRLPLAQWHQEQQGS